MLPGGSRGGSQGGCTEWIQFHKNSLFSVILRTEVFFQSLFSTLALKVEIFDINIIDLIFA